MFELQLSDHGSSFSLENPDLFQGLTHRVSKGSESSAMGALRTYNTAIATYHSTYPDAGFPSSLEVLGTGDESGRDHACLVDAMLSTPPYEKSGYRFTYQLIDVNRGSTDGSRVRWMRRHRNAQLLYRPDRRYPRHHRRSRGQQGR